MNADCVNQALINGWRNSNSSNNKKLNAKASEADVFFFVLKTEKSWRRLSFCSVCNYPEICNLIDKKNSGSRKGGHGVVSHVANS